MQRYFGYPVKIHFFLFFSFFNFLLSLKFSFAFFITLESLNDFPLYLLDIITIFGAPARSWTQNLLVCSTVDSQMSKSTLQFYIMILRLQSNEFNRFLMPVQCLSITERLQIPCILTCILIPYVLNYELTC